MVRRLAAAAQAGEGDRELQERARSLYVLLLPPPVRQFLARLDGPLLLDIDTHEVPWEFLHNGETFLGLRQPVGRQLRMPHAPSSREAAASTGDRPSVLLVANPTGDLAGADVEARRLLQFLDDWETQTAWDYLRQRALELEDERVSLAFVEELRAALPELILSANAALATQYVTSGHYFLARAHLEVMAGSPFPGKVAAALSGPVLDPLKRRVTEACRRLEAELREDEAGAFEGCRQF